MIAESTTAARWDELHRDKRHRLEYPSEHVVRWLKSLDYLDTEYALDIGCGDGRHLALLEAEGHRAYGIDASAGAVRRARERLNDNRERRVWRGDMTKLGEYMNGEGYFGIVIAYGVFYYGTEDDMAQAFREMYRVMRPGGHGLVCLRSTMDWRERFLVGGKFFCAGEPEYGMDMTFVNGTRLAELIRPFSEVEVNISQTTTHDGARLNADWLISVRK